MKPDYIKRFEKLGFGIFVHFGLYSIIGKGEWYESVYLNENPKSIVKYEALVNKFKINKNWAKELVRTAKKAGAKYITLTTRHHEGFSLYDTRGLNTFDAPHSACHRDLVKEFVDECNKANIIPFFYHTLLDWHNPDYKNDFPKYIDYLIDSVKILCQNYGKIGGLWFDGYWDKPNADWQFDRLYKTIRQYQPEAMIINNTGLDALGAVSHYDIDGVTFERGKPFKVSSADGKERAGEVCDALTDHWGYAKDDISYKSIPSLINLLIDCRACRCNLLLNSGPKPNGMLNELEKYSLIELGKWVKKNSHIIFDCVPAEIEADNAVIFKDDNWYYAVIRDVPMSSNENVARRQSRPQVVIHTDKRITNACYMDNKQQKVVVDKKEKSFPVLPFMYGTSQYARVVRFKLK